MKREDAVRAVSRAFLREFHDEPSMGHSTMANRCSACDQARDTAIAALSLAGFDMGDLT